jgi:hypothetical protein
MWRKGRPQMAELFTKYPHIQLAVDSSPNGLVKVYWTNSIDINALSGGVLKMLHSLKNNCVPFYELQ